MRERRTIKIDGAELRKVLEGHELNLQELSHKLGRSDSFLSNICWEGKIGLKALRALKQETGLDLRECILRYEDYAPRKEQTHIPEVKRPDSVIAEAFRHGYDITIEPNGTIRLFAPEESDAS